jgi:hypothetical protein
MIRFFAKVLLSVVTGAVPVLIAACYGVSNVGPEGSCGGKVVDKTAGTGVTGIEVHCLNGAGDSFDVSVSASDGSFLVQQPVGGCASLEARDVDGAARGSYATATVPADRPSCLDTSIRIELVQL